jgi:hypothetical protein
MGLGEEKSVLPAQICFFYLSTVIYIPLLVGRFSWFDLWLAVTSRRIGRVRALHIEH